MSLQNEIFDGFAKLEEFAKAVNRRPSTIKRWIKQPDGLPCTRVGYHRLIHIETARQWMLSRTQQNNPRRSAKHHKAEVTA
jgi:hypothetical protein